MGRQCAGLTIGIFLSAAAGAGMWDWWAASQTDKTCRWRPAMEAVKEHLGVRDDGK